MTIKATNKKVIRFYDDQPPQKDMASEVKQGLSLEKKALPAKFFYDERGSKLFEIITHLPEYYVTRTEINLLRDILPELKNLIGDDPEIQLYEYGSGASIKIRLLLQAIKPKLYIPMDISKDFLLWSADRLVEDYPWLDVYAACVDYSQPISLPTDMLGNGQKLGFFPGSSIGNFNPEQAQEFLSRVKTTLGKKGSLLIGVDLKKDKQVLENAYNDCQGITSAFNKNVLTHINDQLHANFDLDRFDHCSIYNEEEGRIEMHLTSTVDQIITVDEQSFAFKQGESIHTENSYKYSPDGFSQLAKRAGFNVKKIWTDKRDYFGLFYLD